MAALAVCTFFISGTSLAQDRDCGRDCLLDSLDDYLEAVVAGEPEAADLSPAYRHTENAVALQLGQGIWASLESLGEVQRRYVDEVTGNAFYFGSLDEVDETAIAALRLRVEDREITEAEWNIARAGDPGIRGEPAEVLFSVEMLTESPPPQRVVPQRDRLSRETLIAIANSYFDGITAWDASVIRGHPGCTRFENGFSVTNGPSDCMSGQGEFNVIFVADRRYFVDVEAQLVIASAVFIREPGNDKRRNFFAELFFIDEGMIRDVYAAMYYPPPTRAVPNWPPYNGNFPLPATYGDLQ
jgi:hypothetical protein